MDAVLAFILCPVGAMLSNGQAVEVTWVPSHGSVEPPWHCVCETLKFAFHPCLVPIQLLRSGSGYAYAGLENVLSSA